MIYKVDFEGQACKQIKEKAESYQYDLKSVLKGIGLLIADMWLPGDSKPQINTWEGLFEKVQEDYSYKDTIVENDFICNSERIENVDQIVVKDMVEDLIKTIDIIDGKIILIAHSLGCRIAQMCLEEIYSSIQSVVLITPMPVRNNFLQLLQMSKKQRKNNLEYILFSERLDSEQKEYYMSLLDKESKKVEYAMMKRQKKFSIYVRKIPTLVIGSYNDQCVILQAVKDNAKIHTAELKIVDSVCHDMMLDPDWRNIADLIFKFIEKTIDKKSGDNYNDNYVSTQAHQGGE